MIPQKTIEELINKHSILEKDLSEGRIDKKLFEFDEFLIEGIKKPDLLFTVGSG